MSIKITVKSVDRHERTVKDRRIWEQEAWAHTFGRDGKPDPFPVKIRLTTWSDKSGNPESPAYAPGEYTLDARSFYVGDFGRLELTPRLVALATAARAA